MSDTDQQRGNKWAGPGWPDLLRAVVVTGLLGWIALAIDWPVTWRLFIQAELPLLLMAVLLILFTIGLKNLRWYLLLRTEDRPLTFTTLYRFQLTSQFASIALPTNIGGDAYRALLLARAGLGYSQAAASVIIDRAIGVCVLLALALWGLLAFLSGASAPILTLVFATALFLSLGALVFAGMNSVWRQRLLRVPVVGRSFGSVLDSSQHYLRQTGLITAVTVLSIASHLVAGAISYILARALGADPDLIATIAVSMVVFGISAIPISINGLGVAEASWIILFPAIGVTAPVAAGVALLWRACNLAVSMLGGLLLLRSSRMPLTPPAREVK